MTRFLVTGAGGFIGRALCMRLAGAGCKVRGTVSSHTEGLPVGVEAVPADIGSSPDWESILKGVDTVVHLAARVHIMREKAPAPLEAFRRVNLHGTLRLAQAAAAASVRRLVFMSTVGVHGNTTAESSFTESSPFRPHNAYAQSKWEAEEALLRIAASSKLEISILRAPLVYGPGNPGNFLRLLDWVWKGWPLPVASIRNQRSFIYAGNLINAIETCIYHPGAAGRTFLVSDGHDLSTAQLLTELSRAMKRPSRLFPAPPRLLMMAAKVAGLSEPAERVLGSLSVDSSRIMKELGWRPPFTPSEGLRETALWYLESRLKPSNPPRGRLQEQSVAPVA